MRARGKRNFPRGLGVLKIQRGKMDKIIGGGGRKMEVERTKENREIIETIHQKRQPVVFSTSIQRESGKIQSVNTPAVDILRECGWGVFTNQNVWNTGPGGPICAPDERTGGRYSQKKSRAARDHMEGRSKSRQRDFPSQHRESSGSQSPTRDYLPNNT